MEFGLLGVMVIVFGEMCIELIFIDFDVVYWFVIKFENIRRERERRERDYVFNGVVYVCVDFIMKFFYVWEL